MNVQTNQAGRGSRMQTSREQTIIGQELSMVRRYGRGLVRSAPFLAAAVVLWTAGPAAGTAANQLPTAREIVDKFVKSSGGADAFKAVSSMRARGSFTISGQGLSGTLEMLAARPNKLLTRITLGGVGEIEEGYDGKVGWSIDPLRGPSLVTGRSLTERADEAWFDAPLHGADHVKEMSVLGSEQQSGRTLFRLKVVTVRGTEAVELFDADTGYQVGIEASRETPFGIVPMKASMQDYRRFGQLTFPSRLVQNVLGQEQVFVFSDYEFNTVPASSFDLPASIKALIK
jgi:hypothetical protein